jgi:hypothetical protein
MHEVSETAILLVSEAQRQRGWFACLKTLPTYESRAARERISPMFGIQDTDPKPKIILMPFWVTGVAIQPPI